MQSIIDEPNFIPFKKELSITIENSSNYNYMTIYSQSYDELVFNPFHQKYHISKQNMVILDTAEKYHWLGGEKVSWGYNFMDLMINVFTHFGIDADRFDITNLLAFISDRDAHWMGYNQSQYEKFNDRRGFSEKPLFLSTTKEFNYVPGRFQNYYYFLHKRGLVPIASLSEVLHTTKIIWNKIDFDIEDLFQKKLPSVKKSTIDNSILSDIQELILKKWIDQIQIIFQEKSVADVEDSFKNIILERISNLLYRKYFFNLFFILYFSIIYFFFYKNNVIFYQR